MNTTSAPSSASPHDSTALSAMALRRAQELRREAIDDFWRGADAAWVLTLAGARRSAQRLAYRLARHAQQRAHGSHSVKEV